MRIRMTGDVNRRKSHFLPNHFRLVYLTPWENPLHLLYCKQITRHKQNLFLLSFYLGLSMFLWVISALLMSLAAGKQERQWSRICLGKLSLTDFWIRDPPMGRIADRQISDKNSSAGGRSICSSLIWSPLPFSTTTNVHPWSPVVCCPLQSTDDVQPPPLSNNSQALTHQGRPLSTGHWAATGNT